MVYTSPVKVNKGNIFRIYFFRGTLFVLVREFIFFNLWEAVTLLVPACFPQHFKAVEKQAVFSQIMALNVKRVKKSCYKTSENLLSVLIREAPASFCSCEVKNLSLMQRFFSDYTGKYNWAVVIYQYKVAVTYKNLLGQIKEVVLDSGRRSEYAFLGSSTGCLAIKIINECLPPQFIFERYRSGEKINSKEVFKVKQGSERAFGVVN